jgi:hypothetical protein
MSRTNDPTDTPADATDTAETAVGTIPVTELLKQRGTIPFLGFTPDKQSDYPKPVSAVGEIFDQDPLAFTEAINSLPKAGEGTLWAESEFVETAGDTVDIDLDEIRNVHGLDIDSLEAATGQSLQQLAEAADPDPLVRVTDHKDIIDRRRLALRALGFQVKFRWQIASDSYDPGDMQTFLTRKVAACQKQGIDQVFGWIRMYDWGGQVKIVSIYPDLAYEVSRTAQSEQDDEQDELDDWVENVDENDDGGAVGDSVTVYYGDRIGYGFRGTQTIWVYPVIYVPAIDVMVPLPKPRYKRRHVGDVMDEANERANDRVPIIEWHESILTKLDRLATNINDEIQRARRYWIDFDAYPFDAVGFYDYLGLPTKIAEAAADRATSLAEPPTKPTLWNVQLALKLALLDEFQGSRAGDTYQEYQEVAGQILRFPGQQIELALEEYENDQQDDDAADPVLPEDQETLADSIEDITELPGIGTETELSDTEAERITERVQRRLTDSS